MYHKNGIKLIYETVKFHLKLLLICVTCLNHLRSIFILPFEYNKRNHMTDPLENTRPDAWALLQKFGLEQAYFDNVKDNALAADVMIHENIDQSVLQSMFFFRKEIEGKHPLFSRMTMRMTEIGKGIMGSEVNIIEELLDGNEIYSGVYTILIDSLMGSAAFSSMNPPSPIATVNLKTDVLGKAFRGETIVARAEIMGESENIIYARGKITADDRLVAIGEGSFIIKRSKDLSSSRI